MKKLVVLVVVVLMVSALLPAEDKLDLEEAVKTPEGTINVLYDLVTFEKNAVPDWQELRSLFHPKAVITLRTSMAGMTTMDLQGFIDLWIKDVKKMKLDETGFIETIKTLKIRTYGRLSHAFVVYEPCVPGSKRPPYQGLDSFTLIQENDRWYITAIANDVIHPAKAVPEEFLK